MKKLGVEEAQMPFATDIYAAFYRKVFFYYFKWLRRVKKCRISATMTDEEALLPIFRDRAIVCRRLDIMKPFTVSGDFFFFTRLTEQ